MATIKGTILDNVNEADIVAGGKTVIIDLAIRKPYNDNTLYNKNIPYYGESDTWVAPTSFINERQNIINGMTSNKSEATGWNAVVKANQGVAGVVRTSDTIATITLDAFGSYDISEAETITVTIPSTALTGETETVASPAFTISAIITYIYGRLMTMGVG
jgi:hypothetical protein